MTLRPRERAAPGFVARGPGDASGVPSGRQEPPAAERYPLFGDHTGLSRQREQLAVGGEDRGRAGQRAERPGDDDVGATGFDAPGLALPQFCR